MTCIRHEHTYTHRERERESIDGKAVHELIAKIEIGLPSSISRWRKLAVPVFTIHDQELKSILDLEEVYKSTFIKDILTLWSLLLSRLET
jgi:hypothetical protein